MIWCGLYFWDVGALYCVILGDPFLPVQTPRELSFTCKMLVSRLGAPCTTQSCSQPLLTSECPTILGILPFDAHLMNVASCLKPYNPRYLLLSDLPCAGCHPCYFCHRCPLHHHKPPSGRATHHQSNHCWRHLSKRDPNGSRTWLFCPLLQRCHHAGAHSTGV